MAFKSFEDPLPGLKARPRVPPSWKIDFEDSNGFWRGPVSHPFADQDDWLGWGSSVYTVLREDFDVPIHGYDCLAHLDPRAAREYIEDESWGEKAPRGGNLVAFLEERGVRVLSLRDLSIQHTSARLDGELYVFLNPELSGEAGRRALAWEFGYQLFRSEQRPNHEEACEKASVFSDLLLMPTFELRRLSRGRAWTVSSIVKGARYFGVSCLSLFQRLKFGGMLGARAAEKLERKLTIYLEQEPPEALPKEQSPLLQKIEAGLAARGESFASYLGDNATPDELRDYFRGLGVNEASIALSKTTPRLRLVEPLS